MNLTYWNIGMESFTLFTNKIITSPSISLDQTRKVLSERNQLTNEIQKLSKKLREGLNQVETIKGYLKVIIDLKGNINDSKDFKQKIKKIKTRQYKLSKHGIHIKHRIQSS